MADDRIASMDPYTKRMRYEEALPPRQKKTINRERYFDPKTRKTMYRDIKAPEVAQTKTRADIADEAKREGFKQKGITRLENEWFTDEENAKTAALRNGTKSSVPSVGPTRAAAEQLAKTSAVKAAPAAKAASVAAAKNAGTPKPKAKADTLGVSPNQRSRATSAAKSSAGWATTPEELAVQKRIDENNAWFEERKTAAKLAENKKVKGLARGGIVPVKPVKPASSKLIKAKAKGLKSAIKPAKSVKPFAKGGAVSKTVKPAAPKSAVKSSKSINGVARKGLTRAR